MTFRELYKKWHAEKATEVKPGTASAYRMTWVCVADKIGDLDVGNFGRIEAKAMLHGFLESGLSPKTAKDRMAMIKQMVLYAATDLGIAVRPMGWNLRYPAKEPRRLQRYTQSELQRLIKIIIKDFEAGDCRFLPVLISALTGMRIGEVCGLQWGDIDFRHRMLYVRRNVTKSYDPFEKRDRLLVGTPKTQAGYREIPLLPLLSRLLKTAMPEGAKPDHYATTGSYVPMSPATARGIFDSCIRKCKTVPRITFHGLRHTFATLLVESKSDIKTVSEILGHSNVTVTLNLYVHPTLEAKKKAVSSAFRKLMRQVTDN